MHRKITRQSRWNLRRASDKAIPNQAPGMVGEGVETGWRAPLVGEGTVRLSSKGESDRITQRSAVQIRPPRNHERHCRNAVAFACLQYLPFLNAAQGHQLIDHSLETTLVFRRDIESRRQPV